MLNEEILKEFLLGNKFWSVREIKAYCNGIGDDISSIKLANILKNLKHIQIDESDKPFKYRLKEENCFTGKIEKVKNILKMELDNGKYIEYDFNSQSFLGNRPDTYDKGIEKNFILEIFINNSYRKLRGVEWLYNYMELLDNNLENYDIPRRYFKEDFLDIFEKCPTGYINHIKENSLKINFETLKDYVLKQNYPYVPKPLLNEYSLSFLKILNLLFKEHNLDKMIKNSIKNFELNIKDDLEKLVDIIEDLEDEEIKWSRYIDSNRSLIFNYENLRVVSEENYYKFLSENLQKLNFLNNQEFSNYIVVVPQNVRDLLDEGRQQNNCVGHFYNCSINEGINLIYFLRKKETPQKSCITCRYSIDSERTVEHRTKNNYNTTEQQDKIINEIDKIINEYFKKQLK